MLPSAFQKAQEPFKTSAVTQRNSCTISVAVSLYKRSWGVFLPRAFSWPCQEHCSHTPCFNNLSSNPPMHKWSSCPPNNSSETHRSVKAQKSYICCSAAKATALPVSVVFSSAKKIYRHSKGLCCAESTPKGKMINLMLFISSVSYLQFNQRAFGVCLLVYFQKAFGA